MSNKEKAREIASIYFPVGSPHYTSEVAAQIDCQNAVIKMAEWKDQQFKEYLKKKRSNIYWDETSLICRNTKLDLLDEIINELFPVQEQDNSDNEE